MQEFNLNEIATENIYKFVAKNLGRINYTAIIIEQKHLWANGIAYHSTKPRSRVPISSKITKQ